MLTSSELQDQIDQIVEDAYLDFEYRMVGEDHLTDEQKRRVETLGLVAGGTPLAENLYLAARRKARQGELKERTAQELLRSVEAGNLGALTDEEKYSVTHAKEKISQSIQESKNEVKGEIKEKLLQSNIDHKRDLEQIDSFNPQQRQAAVEENANDLLTGLTVAAVGTAAVKAFRKHFTSAMTETINTGISDEIGAQARTQAGAESDPWVYKQIVDDDRTSRECRRLHTVGGSGDNPRLYRLSTLKNNGTNIGKPRSQWKAVIGGTHPNCRCTLHRATEDMIKQKTKKE